MPAAVDLLSLFAALPSATLLLSPTLIIEAVSEAYLAVSFTTRDQLVGRSLFDVFGGEPGTAEHPTMTNLRASLQQVLTTGQPDQLPVQPYAVKPLTGTPETRYWQPLNTPIRDAQGTVTAILHTVTEVTSADRLRQAQAREQQALAEVEAQRRHLQQVLRHLPAQVATYQGPDYVYDFVNTRYTQPLPTRHYLGRPFQQVLPEVAAQGLLATFDHVYQTGEPVHLPEQELWLDLQGRGESEQLYLDFYLQPLRDAEGQIYGLLDFTYDVTAQVRARQRVEQLNDELEIRVQERTQALHAKQQQLEQLFMQAPAPIVILDGPRHVYHLVNPAFQHLFPNRVLLGKPALEALPELAGSPLAAILQHVYQTGEAYVASEMLLPLARQEDGPLEDRSWTFVYQARRNERGHIDGILVFAHEVTDQVRARRATEHNAQQLRLLTDALPVLIAYVDQQQRYQFANEAYRTWFQFDPATLLGQPVWDVMNEQLYTIARPYIRRALAGERLDFEAQVLHQDRLRYIHTSYIPDLRAGKVAGFYALVQDITEQVVAHQQVQELNKELQATNEDLRHSNAKLQRTNTDLDTFVYAASHDLRSPIVNIVGLLNLLRHQLQFETQDALLLRLVDLMEESITRFRQTVDHLSTIARLDAPEHLQEEVELARVIEDIRLDLLPLLDSTQATLEVDVTACPTLRFSPKDLRSILFNLLSNAVKYHAPDRLPRVQVRAQCSPTQFVLEVQDNGLGLDENQQRKLFAMFRRLHTHVEGSGVGLYLIKRLIENADGTITVQSQPGIGSTFTVWLPLPS